MKFQVTGDEYGRTEDGRKVTYIWGQVVESDVNLATKFPNSFVQVDDLAIPSTPYPSPGPTEGEKPPVPNYVDGVKRLPAVVLAEPEE
jgi:hypothetical protein